MGQILHFGTLNFVKVIADQGGFNRVNNSYSGIRGTPDFSPSQTLSFNKVIQKAKEIFVLFNYKELILPLLEEAGLFIRGLGKTTDIVQKQMFKVVREEELKKDIVLRPEGTAQVVRYYLEESLYNQSSFHKFFYIGPMFRGERPQKGRLRQFHHIGAEAFGSDSVFLDVELITLALRILDEIGIKEKELKINTLGCTLCKSNFSKNLKKFLQGKINQLCEDCQKRFSINPVRTLDCKQSGCKEVVSSFNMAEAYLCAKCQEQFKNLLLLLGDSNIKYTYDFTLVRGLDYYTNTVFEIVSRKLGSQDALGAGGRYNNLVKDLGGPDIPAIGFALGIERILLILDEAPKAEKVDVFVAIANESLMKEGFKVLQDCRDRGIPSDFDYSSRSLKGQLRYAQKRGAKFVAILGEEELKDNCITVKDMAKSSQQKIKRDDLISFLGENA